MYSKKRGMFVVLLFFVILSLPFILALDDDNVAPPGGPAAPILRDSDSDGVFEDRDCHDNNPLIFPPVCLNDENGAYETFPTTLEEFKSSITS